MSNRPSPRRDSEHKRRGGPVALLGAAGLALLACSSAAVQDGPSKSTSSATTGIPASMSWSGWANASGGLASDPSIVSVNNADFSVVAADPNGDVWANWYNGTSWPQYWTELGNNGHTITLAPTSVVATVSGSPVIAVFAIDSSGALLKKFGHPGANGQTPTWDSGWTVLTPPSSLTVAQNGPPTVVVSQPNSQINVFVTLSDGSAGVASGVNGVFKWTLLSGANILYQPGAVSWGSNRLDVFVAAGAYDLYHRYSNDNGVTWYPAGGSWEPLNGSVFTTPQVASWGVNRLDIFAGDLGTYGGTIQHLAWTGGSWGTCSAPPCWETLPGNVWQDEAELNDPTSGLATPAVITLGPGQMQVFAQGPERQLVDLSLTADETSTSVSQWSSGSVTSCFRTTGTPAVTTDHTGFAVAITGYDPSGDSSVWVDRTGGSFATTGTPPVSCVCPGNGEAGQPACATTTFPNCEPTGCNCDTVPLTVVNGICTPCGGSGQVPCGTQPSSQCDSGFTVSTNGSACVPCGANGQPACTECGGPGGATCPLPNSGCNVGTVNVNQVCECGAIGQIACFVGNKCTACASGSCPIGTNADGSGTIVVAEPSGLNTCEECGKLGQPVCTTGAACASGASSPAGTCECPWGTESGGNGSCSVSCGGHGQVCCQAAPGCDENDTCTTSGTCQCGGNGQRCCAGGSNTGCDSGYVCNANGQCQACGGLDGICCHNGTCNGGTCVDSTPPQCVCGGLGQACCPGSSCSGGNTCSGGVCAVPRQPAPTCVGAGGGCGSSSGPYCCANEVCNYGKCLTCIPHGNSCASSPNPCCSWQDTCVIDQETGGSQCDIGDSDPGDGDPGGGGSGGGGDSDLRRGTLGRPPVPSALSGVNAK